MAPHPSRNPDSNSHHPSSSTHRKLSSSSIRIPPSTHRKTCPICLTYISDHNPAILPNCFHAYCLPCIQKWSQVKRTCPLCKSEFNSWFVRTRVSYNTFKQEHLPELNSTKRVERGGVSPNGFRELRRSINEVNQQSRPLPWRRSFGRQRFVPRGERDRYEADVGERVLRWRASIYSRRLQAVPLPPANQCKEKNISHNSNVKHRMQQRIEPWIKRELQAILGDPDPSVIVHLTTTIYILSIEEKLNKASASSHRLPDEDRYVEQLRPFLQDTTNLFWHELRCFAESTFEMTTYDSLVEYKQLE